MKILMTGMTPRTIGSKKLLYSFMSNCSVIKTTLELAGHTVEQRAVSLEEKNVGDNYDVALVGLSVPQSLSSRYVFGALWTAEQFGIERVRFYVDDWLLHQFISQLESGLREPEKRYYSLPNRMDHELAKSKTDIWVKWFTHLAKEPYNLLLPCFTWSKPRHMLPRMEHVTPVIFDPTPLAFVDSEILCGEKCEVKLQPAKPEDRARTWTLATLRDLTYWYEKQTFGWPVQLYGNKRLNQEVVTERQLLDIYCKSWGVLGAPYAAVSSGCGWRVRYIHSAITESVLVVDPEEGRTAGPCYNLNRKALEKATTEQLADIAGRQRKHLIEKSWKMDELVSNMDAFIRG